MKKTIYIILAVLGISTVTYVGKNILDSNSTGIQGNITVYTEAYQTQQDTIKAYLSKVSTPNTFVDSTSSMEGNSTYQFNRSNTNGNYYLTIRHRNSIRIWSNPIYLEFDSNKTFTYDFTNDKDNTLYHNVRNVNGKYCMYSGDVNQDRIIDVSDMSAIENSAYNSDTGYINTDLNNDRIVDVSDISILENNINIFERQPTLILPARDSNPIKAYVNRDVLLLPYTSVIKVNNTFFMYYITNNTTKLDTSLDGVNWKFKANVTVNSNNTPAQGDSCYSVIYKNGTWYSGWTCHATVNKVYTEFINVAGSSDGVHFVQYSGNPLSFRTGEDLSFFDNTDSFYCYIRPAIPSIVYPRAVGLMTSIDYVNWTSIDTLIKFPNSEYTNPSAQLYLKQPYNMNVFRIGDDWWGFLHTLRIEDDVTENSNFPYTGLEGTVETLLMYSRDGRNWSYTNNKQALLPIHDSVKQVYALPTVVNDSLYIYSFESTLRHAGYSLKNGGQPAVDFAKGKYWKILRYRFAIADLNLYKQ